ncbi:hypothetical protein Hypma_000693 [Hypsizygus marmoreus]|uniref:O-methylsterigmatocystin oxidoreductase n=1 Tax=Hypsizygus marmoreus TaxID=39966 RepID=A0A369J9W9_HYPMA|nr:hypothetical protein Hypma_000693 [Hypsizygus marmoreus]
MALPLLFLAFFLLASALIYTRISKRHPPLPPGPPADPIIGHARLIPTSGQDMFFYELGKKYGEIVHLQVLGRSIVVLNSFQAAVDLLDKRSANYSDRPKLPIFEMMGFLHSLAFMRYGKDFRMHRRMVQQSFGKGISKAYRPIQAREARLLAQKLLSSPDNRDELLLRFSTAIIIEIAFGHQITADNDPYLKAADDVCFAAANSGPPGGTFVDLFPILRYFPSWFPGAYYAGFARYSRPIIRRIHDMPLADVTEQMAKGTAKPSFLVSQLEHLQREDPGNTVGIDHATGAAAVLYVAGAETTSSTLSFFFLAMALHPECQLKAQREIDAVTGGSRLPEFNDRDDLPFLECLLQETLRWHHAVPIGMPHRSMEDDIYNGMFIPGGSIMIANTRGMTLDEKVYKDPLKFDPERFLPQPLGRGEPNPNAAFGFGRRVCPGRYLAVDSLWIAMASILSTMSILKPRGEDGKEIAPEIGFISGITCHPSPFRCRLQPRMDLAKHY